MRAWTIGLLAVALVGLIGWDVWMAVNPTSGDTISEITLCWSRKVWTLPLAVGVVCGHLFWPLRRERPVWFRFASLGGLAAVAITGDLVGHPAVLPTIPLLIGVLIGHWCWGQS